ncbi:MAG: hypothetical protein ACJA1F_001239 [Paracoccaceae bacterium]|jgi:hypothetical protein
MWHRSKRHGQIRTIPAPIDLIAPRIILAMVAV